MLQVKDMYLPVQSDFVSPSREKVQAIEAESLQLVQNIRVENQNETMKLREKAMDGFEQQAELLSDQLVETVLKANRN